jgi:hypothetical protein
MHFSASQNASRLPRRFPVGTTYVVEGRGGGDGELRVFSRYVVLPGGQRINLDSDFGGPASPHARGRSRKRGQSQVQSPEKRRSSRAKKIIAGAGTSRRHGR